MSNVNNPSTLDRLSAAANWSAEQINHCDTECQPCTCCGVLVSEDDALGCADTEWLCEDCFPQSVLHCNGWFGDSATGSSDSEVEQTAPATEQPGNSSAALNDDYYPCDVCENSVHIDEYVGKDGEYLCSDCYCDRHN